MKRVLLILLALVLLFSLAACKIGGTPDPTGNIKSSVAPSTDPEESQTPTETSVEEQVICDDGSMKITVKSFEVDEFWGPQLKLLIENNSDKNITVQTNYCVINGFMVDTTFSTDVASGKKATDSITIFDTDLEACGIEKIAEIKVELHYFDSDTWDDINTFDEVTICTNQFGSYEQKYDDSGFVAYEGNGVRVIAKGVVSDEIWGDKLVFYIENNSENNLTVQVRDVSVNGFMVDTLFSADIRPGAKIVDDMIFSSEDFEENEIAQINNIEFYLTAFDADTWEDIFDTDIISLDITY